LETHRQTLALKLQQTQQQLQLQQQQHQLQQLQQQHLKKLLQIQTLQNLQKLEEAVASEKNEVRAKIDDEPIANTTPAAEAVDVEVVTTPAVVEEDKTPIQQFYDKASIFMTGGTGFMGKCMIEKLLRTCTSLECIYLLVRPKKGKDVHTRIDELFEDSVSNRVGIPRILVKVFVFQLFDIVRETIPKFRHKVIAVPGDCSIAGLGLNLCDRQTLINNVSIVFHVAATVRFDEHLRMAMNINVHGTRDVLELCNHMEKLKVRISRKPV
jgi:FlaA1/EpsC-like NDP-sugar epimerase